MSRDLKHALRSTRDMDEYLEVRSTQEIIDDINQMSAEETLRDRFAATALPEFIRAIFAVVSSGNVTCDNDDTAMSVAAEKAYAMADAMLGMRSPVGGAK